MVEASLNYINPKYTKALAVVVNNMGGMPTQGDIICNKLLHFTSRHHMPLYTFAEDFALSGGYQIFCIGISPISFIPS